MGGQAAGGVLMGWIAETFGGQLAFLLAGAVPLLTAAVLSIVLALRHELRIRVDLRRPRRLLTIVSRAA